MGDGAWMRPDTTLVFASRQDIIAGKAPLNPINQYADGSAVTSGNLWTGTASVGTITGTTCNDWMAYGPTTYGTYGQIAMTSVTWTNAGSLACNDFATFLCFGVP